MVFLLVFILGSGWVAVMDGRGEGEHLRIRDVAIFQGDNPTKTRWIAVAPVRLRPSRRSIVARSTARMLPMHPQEVHASVFAVPATRSRLNCACAAGRRNAPVSPGAGVRAIAMTPATRYRVRPDTAGRELVGEGIGATVLGRWCCWQGGNPNVVGCTTEGRFCRTPFSRVNRQKK